MVMMNELNDQPKSQTKSLQVAVITCAVLELEIEHFIKGMDHIVHLEKLEQGLHDEPDKLREQLQLTIDQVETSTKATTIILGYGVCSRGTEGLRSKKCQLVIARAHDCITLLLGSRQRYNDYVAQFPGTYWYSPGWNHHHTPPGKERYEKLYNQYLEKYGDDNARYLMEMEQNWFNEYSRATYVELTVGVTDEDINYTKECANWLNWQFDHQRGDPLLLKKLLTGPWDEDDFLVLQPGQTFRLSNDERVIELAENSA